jgi:hypothetical protein
MKSGDQALALEHYKKFLALWKDADPSTADSHPLGLGL